MHAEPSQADSLLLYARRLLFNRTISVLGLKSEIFKGFKIIPRNTINYDIHIRDFKIDKNDSIAATILMLKSLLTKYRVTILKTSYKSIIIC